MDKRYMYAGSLGIVEVKIIENIYKNYIKVELPNGKIKSVRTNRLYNNELILKIKEYNNIAERIKSNIETYMNNINILKNELKDKRKYFNIDKIQKENPELFII